MRPRVVVLGMMAKMPVPGVVWQTVHYLIGLRRLGMDPYYVEAHGRTPSMLMEEATDDSSTRAAGFISQMLRRFDLGDRWCFHALHDDGRCFGLSATELRRLYRESELIINLHGGTRPRPELSESGRLIYLETDPVRLQIELHDGVEHAIEFLEPHTTFFTFAENLGRPGCELPVCERFRFRPTRQPVVLDLWADRPAERAATFTTIGNWQQGWRTVRFRGEDYSWSKDTEWMKFMQLPRRSGSDFELALSGYQPRHREYLEKYGWRVRDALAFGSDVDAYRDYITGSRAEFTVAKDQNIRFRTGWFSDRSATYLAAGRPVITQDTAFGCALPTGEGLFAVSTLDEAVTAVEAIDADYQRHRRAASEIAREYFDAERVLGAVLEDAGMPMRRGMSMQRPAQATSADGKAAAGIDRRNEGRPRKRTRLTRESSVLALIPHFRCEEWLDECLASLLEQTRPLDGIVVIDDASDSPPVRLVQRYPEVTLLHAERNVGPYRLIQQVIEDTDYDAYLFQDADDWSAPDRLERLLEGAERTGAELIGTQEMRVFCDEPEAVPIRWPLDVDAVFRERATAFPLLHPTSLVSRELVLAAPFSTGLRFGGDAEFLRRARFIAHVANVPGYSYYRRIRQGSLTTAPATRIGSPVRKQIMELTFARANSNAERVANGEEPDLSPIKTAPPVGFTQLAGPPLRRQGDATARERRPRARAAREVSAGPPTPIFVVGGDRSGATALACALGQHPRIALSAEGGFMGELARRLAELREAATELDPNALGPEPPSPKAFSAAFGPAAAGLIGCGARWVDGSWQHTHNIARLKELFPQAKFIHIARDAGSAIRAAVDPPLGSAGATGGTQIPERLRTKLREREALERWTEAVEACMEAERSLGQETVLRVTYADLLSAPEAVVRRCLEFAGESYAPQCLRPLRGLRTEGLDDRRAAGQQARESEEATEDEDLWRRARALSRTLLGPEPGPPPTPHQPAAEEPDAQTGAAPARDSDKARRRAQSRRTTREVLSEKVPQGATVLVVSRGDDELLDLEGRRCLHFPQIEGGVWAGSHPADSAEAIAHLDELRAAGARFLFFPCTSLWWLDHYRGLARHLQDTHTAVLRDTDRGALFELHASNGNGGPKSAKLAVAAVEQAVGACSRPPRVVMVTDHFPKFSETFFVSKFLGLRRRGWDVRVVSNRSNREHWAFFPDLREQIGDRLHVTKDVEAKLMELRPDLIHFGYGTLARGRMDLGESLGCKLVVSFRGYDINSFGVEDMRCYEDVWQSADMIHAVGESIWERAQRRGCPSDRPHVVINDAVDVSLFQPPERDNEQVGTAERPFRILSVGRTHWKKGHEYALAAMRLLLDRGIQVRYRIIGDGEHREPTLFSIEDLGVADHVELMGGKPAGEVRKNLRWADAFLHPSLTEAFGVAVIEAQAMTLPVVCSDAGGLPENVADGVSGFVVPRRDPAALADRLARLAEDPQLRERMGKAARRRAEERFDIEHQLDRFEQLYRDLLSVDRANGNGRPAVFPAEGAAAAARRAEEEKRDETLQALRKELSALEVRSERLRQQVWGREVVERVQEFAAGSLPRYANVLVISRGDERLVDIPGRHGAHFPQADGGAWAGHHPEHSSEAIEHLQELHRRGAEYLLIPGTSQWWLEHYAEFREHLERSYLRVAATTDYVVFSLDEEPSPEKVDGVPTAAPAP